MDAKEVFDKIREVQSLEARLKGVKPEFGNPYFMRYNQLSEELGDYCKKFSIKDLFQLYSQAQNEKQFAVQYALLIQS